MQRQGSRHICCAHLFTQWFVMTSWAAGCVLAGSPAGAGCCLMRLLWGSTLCLARGSHVLCPTSDFLSAVVRGIVPVGDRASPPFRFLCWAPGRVWRAPGEAQARAFVAVGRGAVLGIHWRRGRLGSLPSSPPAPSPAHLWLPALPALFLPHCPEPSLVGGVRGACCRPASGPLKPPLTGSAAVERTHVP